MSRRIDMLVVHHSASPRSTTLAEIDAWHRDRGMHGIGYHFVVGEDGMVQTARPLREPGAHARGYNLHSIGLCLTGDNTKPEQAWNAAQLETLYKFVHWFKRFHPGAGVVGHRDLPEAKTLCPGLNLQPLLTEMGE